MKKKTYESDSEERYRESKKQPIEESHSQREKNELEIADLDPDIVKKIRAISYYIAKVGLNLDEACILSGFKRALLNDLMDTNETVREIIERKDLEFKKDMLSTISKKARSGADSNAASWMLERKYPQEFGNARYRKVKEAGDPIQDIIDLIRSQAAQNPIVQDPTQSPPLSQASTPPTDEELTIAQLTQKKPEPNINDLLK